MNDPRGVVERIDARPAQDGNIKVSQQPRIDLPAAVGVGPAQLLAGTKSHILRDQLCLGVPKVLGSREKTLSTLSHRIT